MFAAGRATSSTDAQGARDDAQTDWLSVGTSFPKGDEQKAAKSTESALQVYKRRDGKHRHKEKKKHKEKKQRSSASSREGRHLSKHKKKSKDKKRRRSWSSESSDDEDTRHSAHRSRRRHRSSSRSHSRSRSRREENRIVQQSAKDIVEQRDEETDSGDKLFEIDSVGDRDNRIFGSTYAHEQPLYELATRRNLLTGAWISRTRAKFATSKSQGKRDEKQESDRYFSLQAQKMERDGRQKRLYLAYSEKRLDRAAAQDKVNSSNQENASTAVVVSRPTEMGFIPLDPVVQATEHKSGNPANEYRDSDDGSGVLLTDGQNVEQHLVERSKILNAAVAANPRNIDGWLDLVAFQEQTLRLHGKTKKINPAMKAGVEEKQAAILAKALLLNPHSRELHRVKLNMTLQSHASGERADFDTFQQQLETLLSGDITNSELWLKLLQTRQQHFGSFSMQSVRDLYARVLNVLRVEYENVTERATTTTELSASTSGSTKKLGIDSPSGRVQEISAMLLNFHFLMCIFEKKAGYGERSIAQLQALIDFSLTESVASERSGGKATHLEALRKFAVRWNGEDAVGFGETETNGSNSSGEEEPPQVSQAEFEEYIQRTGAATAEQVNPPEVLRTLRHKQSLLSASAVYQRHSRIKDPAKMVNTREGEHAFSRSPTSSAASDDSETEHARGGKVIYSNLHGYRISVDDADDTREYERILSELRGTESARARQAQVIKKEKRKHAALEATLSQVEDQRANYDSIGENDRFLKWLVSEEVQTQLQWAPLRSSNPHHQALIEQQPDRATLTEEIQPFLFPVPVVHRWRLVVELLQVCGVECCGDFSWKTSNPVCESLYADSDGDFALLVAPIVSALNPQADGSRTQKLFLDPSDRQVLLENSILHDVAVKQDVLRDPSKIAFIRRVFAQPSSVFGGDFESTLKCLRIGFEAEVTLAAGVQDDSLAYSRRLSQKLALKTNGDTDFDVLYAYAKLELRLGNERQVRRICDTTLKSLGTSRSIDPSGAFHRFAFLRARLEMWSSSDDQKRNLDQGHVRVLRCLYTLWNVWQPEGETLDEIAKKHRKRMHGYLEERLMSDPSTGSDLSIRCREELRCALQHCAERGCKADDRLPRQSDCWVGFCLHNLALVVYAYEGYEAACNEYRQALASIKDHACSHLAWVWACYLEFMQQHQAAGYFPAVAPRVWRSTIGEAVELYPSNELFLRLFIDSETGNTISQVLRNYFLRVKQHRRRHYDSPELVEWLFALLCEFCRVERAATIKELSFTTQPRGDQLSRPTCCLFHRWGLNATAVSRVREMFESMVTQIRTKGIALCWRLYMRFELALGKVDAAKKVLYRGIAACAWSKTLYLDGIRLLRPYLSEDECQELLEFMEAKELSMRIDFE